MDGRFITNGSGETLCNSFNRGACSKGGRCPNNYSHQCSRCLQNSHGAQDTAKCPKGNGAADNTQKHAKNEARYNKFKDRKKGGPR